MSADYPRDLIGYGNNPPHPHWPGDARIALSFVLNYEEGGERCVLHGDKESEAFLSEMVAAQPLQGVRHMSMESLYEYGSRAGVLAPAQAVQATQRAAHRVRRGHGGAAQP
ncbi:hypothetical protein PA7077_00966 [Pseudomonas aeruginosa]